MRNRFIEVIMIWKIIYIGSVIKKTVLIQEAAFYNWERKIIISKIGSLG